MAVQDDSLKKFGIALGDAFRAWRGKLDERLRPFGFSQAKWLALLYLSFHPEGVIQKDLAALLGVEGPTLVRLLDRLAADGWVARRAAPKDRRAKTVHLTRKAKPTLVKIQKVATQLRHEILGGIPGADLTVSLRVLQKIKKGIDAL